MDSVTRFVAYPVMVVAGIGVVLCVCLYLLGISGFHVLPPKNPPLLFLGIFVVWFPTVILMNRLTRDFKQKDLWKAALRGCPPWMRTALWVIIGCVFVSFFVPVITGRSPGSSPDTFILFPASFYAISFCTMYSLLHVNKFDESRKCLNGHVISPLAKFCEECGAPAAPNVGPTGPA